MSLNVKTRKVDGIVIVDMSGRLTIGEPFFYFVRLFESRSMMERGSSS